MGTEVHYKSSFPGYYSMRDVNEDSNSGSWPFFYADKSLTNGHYYNGFVPRTVTDAYPGYGKDALKQKMLEHEAIFKNQVSELHRLYRRQRDMMEEVKRNEFHKHRISIDTSSSSSLLPCQKPYEDAHRWHIPSFPSTNPASARPSIFGAKISNSPLSCSKGNSSKDCEVLECRPSKVRKKLFDLEVPADEYVDPEEGEQIQDNQASEISSYPPKDTHQASNNGIKTFLDKGTSSSQRFRGSNGLADLNEPVHVEEAIAPSSPDFLDPSAKPAASQFLSQPQELFEKSRIGSRSGASIEGKGNGRDRLSFIRETGNNRSNMNFTSQCSQSNQFHTTSTHPLHHMHGKEYRHPGSYSEISTHVQDNSHFNQNPLPFAASHTPNSYLFAISSDVGNSWSPSAAPSWGKPNGSLTHKLTSFQTHPSFLSSPRNQEFFQNKWHMNGCYKPNTVSGNRFYRGSSSGSKEPSRLPSVGFDYRNCNKIDDGSSKFFKGSNFIDLTDTTKGVDLNTVQTLSNEDDGSKKQEQTMFPWLRAKPTICKNDSLVSNDNRDDVHKERGDSLASGNKILGFPIFGNSCISRNEDSSLVSTLASLRCLPENGKIKKEIEHRGFDINVAWDDATVFEPANKPIDIETRNLGKETMTEIEKIKNHFDLNSCVTEDVDVIIPETIKSSSEKTKKMAMEIDLEAPAPPETEEEANPCVDELTKPNQATPAPTPLQLPKQKLDHPEDEELEKVAAEAIVAISSQQDDIMPTSEVAVNSDNLDRLLWFAEAITSKTVGPTCIELDEYESLTLQLEETKEEDYMPKPLAPDFREPDQGGASSLPNRPRRGQARRGRPRRNFQKDILPGLVSLSRHEVTEDLQIFGGLMRATGHSWNLGLTRRNGSRNGARGRRKVAAAEPSPAATPPPPPLPPPPLEERSLTSWGKTTRRPRRQRCAAAGNSVAVQLT